MTKQFLVLGVLLAGVVGMVCLTIRPVRARVDSSAAPATITEQTDASEEGHEAEPSGYERETRERLQLLEKLEAAKSSRDQAASRTAESRQFLASLYRERWLNVLQTNWNSFMELRQIAAGTRTGETPCTLCDGNGSQHFCVLCPERPGKCVTCQGSGQTLDRQTCPTCLGSKQCYLCFGSSWMLCPFCNNGVIEYRRPVPTANLPVN